MPGSFQPAHSTVEVPIGVAYKHS